MYGSVAEVSFFIPCKIFFVGKKRVFSVCAYICMRQSYR